jgi:hypothetical protein
MAIWALRRAENTSQQERANMSRTDAGKGCQGGAAVGEGFFSDPGRRFPIITAPKGLDALSFLTDEEKKLVVENWDYLIDSMRGKDSEQPPDHAEVQRRNPDHIGLCIPGVWLKEIAMYEDMISGLCGINIAKLMETTKSDQGMGVLDPAILQHFCTAMLMVAKVAHELKVEWTHRLLATSPNCAFLSKQQFGLLGHPKSAVWDKNQRLALEFTEGVVRQTLTDQQFAMAQEAWGSQRLALYARWITYYVGLLLLTVVNITDAEKRGEA